MEYIAGNTNFKLKNTAVTLGKFDGIHLGHQHLINIAVSYQQQGLIAVMFSFLLHPRNIIEEKEFELIYSEEEKLVILENYGIDVLISYPFDEETRSMDPENFIKDILVEKLDAKVIIVGTDFRFGYQRKGDVALLQKCQNQYGYQVIVCEKRTWNHNIISSSSIREALKAGNIEAANEMLGRPYSIRAEVTHGRKLGRTIGMPTINLIPSSSKLLPPCGVYASKTLIDGSYYDGVTNVGFKPTVGENELIGVETYLFDLDQDLYGKILEVEFYAHIRPEMKFESLDELINRMKEDSMIARKLLQKLNKVL